MVIRHKDGRYGRIIEKVSDGYKVESSHEIQVWKATDLLNREKSY